jgi:rhodanese-related sulfurtransferase
MVSAFLAILQFALVLPVEHSEAVDRVAPPHLYQAKGGLADETKPPSAPPTIPHGVGTISLQEAIAWQAQPGVVFADARGQKAFIKGHIPGAIRLGQRTFEADYPAVEEQLRKATKIVLYCTSRQCDDSIIVANKLTALGYKNLFLFEGGWAEWWKHHR